MNFQAARKSYRARKIVNLSFVSTCRATSFECLRHIHLSLRQGTTCPSMTSKKIYHILIILNIAKIGTFKYIQSEGIL